jgi:hypothetical protein
MLPNLVLDWENHNGCDYKFNFKKHFEHEIGLILTNGIFSCKVNLPSFFHNPIFSTQ